MRNHILRYMREHEGIAATWRLRKAGIGNCAVLRRELRKMQAEGLVRLHPRYGNSNNLVWELTEAKP